MSAHDPVILVPTVAQVRGLREGDQVLTCFGSMGTVSYVAYRGTDVYGREYVGFVAKRPSGLSCTGSYKAGELVRTIALSRVYTSRQVDAIERAALEGRDAT